MNISFTKMHGLGNDFVVFDAINQNINLNSAQIKAIADRRFGVGCDQLLLVEKARNAETDFFYRIFNADGSEVEQCGNGARCFARFVADKGLTDKDCIPVGTASGNISLQLLQDGQVKVNMGMPRFNPADLPFHATLADDYSLMVQGQEIRLQAVSMGNPHAIITVDDIHKAAVLTLGPQIENHPAFPQRVNVGFMQILDRSHISLRVWERGAGETLACGSGACAAAVAGIQAGLLDTQVEVQLPGGSLMISWQKQQTAVFMSGPATSVFEGRIEL
ncbi:MAG: diaminopimelate epimerase [gamma proteobacterium symbiont of Bathyaustriella thionipta]|nr:diaminopimelate epimerase [gamma proteobacterium symbiont of Bathyaustriella thionipta]